MASLPQSQTADNQATNAEWPAAGLQMEDQPRPPGYGHRFPTENMDIYNRLRPYAAIESCECETVHELLLIDLLTDNPIHCANCRCEVDPGRIALTGPETEAAARGQEAQRRRAATAAPSA